MPDTPNRITPQEFSERLKAVLGAGPEKAFSEAIGVSISTVYRWVAGDVPVPQYAVAIVEFLEMTPKGFRPERWMR